MGYRAAIGTTCFLLSCARPAPAAPGKLALVTDVDLPGKAVRFDYQDVDEVHGNLVIAHMNDASVVVVRLADNRVVKTIPNVPTARGVAAGPDRIFVTSSPNKLVVLDSTSFAEVARLETGNSPDGVAWDGLHKIAGVSDQKDGALSLVSESAPRRTIALGSETGNVTFDPARGVFWITVVQATQPNELVAIDPVLGKVTKHVPLAGCAGAHGLRIHPDGASALIACEQNSLVVRVDLASGALVSAPSGADPDVLAVDADQNLLYVAAESGDLKVFDLAKPGLALIDSEHVADAAHSVAVDPQTHRVYFPLARGPKGTPVLRIMRFSR